MSQQDMDRTGCLAGCDRSPRDPAVQPTPGQLLHSLHSMSREDQLDAARRMLEASDMAVRCFTRDHDGRLARDDDERAVLLWLHAEAVWQRTCGPTPLTPAATPRTGARRPNVGGTRDSAPAGTRAAVISFLCAVHPEARQIGEAL